MTRQWRRIFFFGYGKCFTRGGKFWFSSENILQVEFVSWRILNSNWSENSMGAFEFKDFRFLIKNFYGAKLYSIHFEFKIWKLMKNRKFLWNFISLVKEKIFWESFLLKILDSIRNFWKLHFWFAEVGL